MQKTAHLLLALQPMFYLFVKDTAGYVNIAANDLSSLLQDVTGKVVGVCGSKVSCQDTV